MRILLAISSLARGGGAERVMARMATYWSARGWDITIVTLYRPSEHWYPVPPTVGIVSLGLAEPSASVLNAVGNNIRRVLEIRRVIRDARPDVVISFVESMNVLTVLATLCTGIPVVISERIAPWRHNPGTFWRWLRRGSYRLADRIIVQTEAAKERLGPLRPGKIVAIPNPSPSSTDSAFRGVTLERNADSRNLLPNGPFILAVGRLVEQKGFDLLLRAFVRLAMQYPSLELVILGDGPERRRLETLAVELGVRDRISMPGQVIDPQAFMERTAVFVLSSRFEGFPNVLLEAMSCGAAIVSFDCDCGPKELIDDGNTGLLVPPEDIRGLADRISCLLDNNELQRRFKNSAKAVAERYAVEKIMPRWEMVIEAVARRGSFRPTE